MFRVKIVVIAIENCFLDNLSYFFDLFVPCDIGLNVCLEGQVTFSCLCMRIEEV